MIRPPVGTEPCGYQLRVGGHLDRSWAASFADFTLTHEADATTTLTGTVADQAELHGLLSRIRDLGLTLVSVTSTPREQSAESTPRATRW